MKKTFRALGLFVAAAFTLTNCTQEIANPVEPSAEGTPFEIVASPAETKTTNDGMATIWAAGDALNLFHAEAGETTYVSDGQFTFATDNTFKGTLNGELEEGFSYDWYAFYPYSSYIKTPANTSNGYMPVGSKSNESQAQTGNNSMAHIAGGNYPLAGKLLDTEYEAGAPVSIAMSHLTSLLEIVVTNNSDEDITVANVSFTAPEDIVGTYYIDFTGAAPAFKSSGDSYVSKTASLKVNSGAAISKNASAKFYLAIKPFTAAATKKLTLSVNGYSKEVTLSNDMTFVAGKIKTLNFSYDKNKVETTALTLPWYEDFSSEKLDAYTIQNSTTSTSETKLYTADSDKLAGGSAPELLIAKGEGAFTAKLATGGYTGNLTLLFKSNYPDRIAVSTPTAGVTITKVSNVEYTLNIVGSVAEFELKFTNTTSSNTRIDDISLVKGVLATQTLTFQTASYSFEYGSAEATAFVGQTVQGAQTTVVYSSSNENVAVVNPQTGAVTLKGEEGSATITAKAAASAEYKEATAEYLIAVSLPSTGTAKTYTFEITTADFNSTSYAANNGEHTSIATAADGSTMEVKWTSNQLMFQNSGIQWQKSKGYIYNTTNLGTIESVTITKGNSGTGTFTTYIGGSPQPTSSGTGGYFKVNVGSATGNIQKIVVQFTR